MTMLKASNKNEGGGGGAMGLCASVVDLPGRLESGKESLDSSRG